MSTTVKIDKKINEEIEKFLASLYLERGVKISKKKALEVALRLAIKNKSAFLKELIIDEDVSLEDDPAWKLLDKPKKWGVKDASVTIDKILYKGEQ